MSPLRIGLTGGIGSGKSTVGAMLGALGARVVDTDLIARSLTTAGGAAMAAIRASFGDTFIAADGSLDRPRMRSAVFDNPGARGRLEGILHPLIGLEVAREAEAAAAANAIVFDVPLLVESDRWRSLVDRVWVVDCGEESQVRRVAARIGWSAAVARSVIGQQATRMARRQAADAVVHNDGISLDDLADTVRALWTSALATGRAAPATAR